MVNCPKRDCWALGGQRGHAFVFCRNFHSVFHKGCICVYSHQQYAEVSFRPRFHRGLLPLVFLLLVMLLGVCRYCGFELHLSAVINSIDHWGGSCIVVSPAAAWGQLHSPSESWFKSIILLTRLGGVRQWPKYLFLPSVWETECNP